MCKNDLMGWTTVLHLFKKKRKKKRVLFTFDILKPVTRASLFINRSVNTVLKISSRLSKQLKWFIAR
jgi:hypothetical protein